MSESCSTATAHSQAPFSPPPAVKITRNSRLPRSCHLPGALAAAAITYHRDAGPTGLAADGLMINQTQTYRIFSAQGTRC